MYIIHCYSQIVLALLQVNSSSQRHPVISLNQHNNAPAPAAALAGYEYQERAHLATSRLGHPV